MGPEICITDDPAEADCADIVDIVVSLHGSTDMRIDMICRATSTDPLVACIFLVLTILLSARADSAIAQEDAA